jgi:hypothetical protein
MENFRQVRRNHHDRKPFVGDAVDELMDFGDSADIDAAGASQITSRCSAATPDRDRDLRLVAREHDRMPSASSTVQSAAQP